MLRPITLGRRANMQLRIKYVTINYEKSGEIDYDVNRPVSAMGVMLSDIMQHYPTLTSLVITIVREKEDASTS
jgi:hypothetical protein